MRTLAVLLIPMMLAALWGATFAPASAYAEPEYTGEEPAQDAEDAKQTVSVEDIDGLIEAIGPNVTVELAPGTYELAAASSYGKDTQNRFCRWETSSDRGYELHIIGVDGLTIRGAGMDETALLAEDRYASVLCFTGCRDLEVSGFTAGHNPMPGYCSGGVIHLVNCDKASVEDCGLFGCGSMGVWGTNSSGVAIISCRIYECSENAVYMDGCRDVRVLDTEIDHNGWKNDYPASCLLLTSGGEGFTVSGCRIHDNTANLLLLSSGTGSTRFVSCRVEYNTLQSVFALYEFPSTVDGCSFHGNDTGSWYIESYDQPSLAAVDSEGKELSSDDFSAMEIRPVAQAKNEEIEILKPIEVEIGGEVTVKTVDEFLAAIGPERTIILDGENFFLANASTYGTVSGQYYHWEACYDGPELVISGVTGLTIRGAEEDPAATTLTAAPRYANVIGFRGCLNVRIANLTLGHSEGFSECSGSVLDFDSCTSVTLDTCRLYGCGTLGVYAWYNSDFLLKNCEIYDCSLGGVVLGNVYGATFEDCRIHDVPSPALSLYGCSGVTWDGEPVTGEYYDLTADGKLLDVRP